MSEYFPQVSIIIPAHNHQDYVVDCLKSVLGQTYRDFEVIIINDGSTDDTGLKISNFLAEQQNVAVTFENQANSGICKTLNKALRQAQGEFIAFIASDDMYLPNFLETLVPILQSTSQSVAAVYCDGYMTDKSGSIIKKYSEENPIPWRKNLFRELIVSNWIHPIGTLYRKAALFDIGLFDENIAFEDYDLFLRLVRRYQLIRIPQALFLYRRHETNFTHDTVKLKKNIELIAKKYKEFENFLKFKEAIRSKKIQNLWRFLNFSNVDLLLRVLIRRLRLLTKT